MPDRFQYERRLEEMIRRTKETVRRSEELLHATGALIRNCEELSFDPRPYSSETFLDLNHHPS